MSVKRDFIPLGSSARIRLEPTGTIVPGAENTVAQLRNVMPLIYTENVTGKKAVKFASRHGFNAQLFARQGSFNLTRGCAWTGVPTSASSVSNSTLVFGAHDGTNIKLYSYDDTGVHTLGTFAASGYECVGIQETLIGTTPNVTMNIRTVSATSTQKALFFPLGGALTEITDGDFPTNTIGQFVHMDGYAFIMDLNGNIWNSDLNSISAWTAASFIPCSAYPDAGVGAARVGSSLIVGFSTNSIQFFENVGNAAGTPLQSIPQATKRIGARHPYDILQVGDTVLFVANSTIYGTGVYQLSGTNLKKISTPWIDTLLRTTYTSNPVYEDQPRVGGHYKSICSMFLGVISIHGQLVALLQVLAQDTDTRLQNIYGYVIGTEDTWINFTYASDTASQYLPCFFDDEFTSFALRDSDGVYYSTKSGDSVTPPSLIKDAIASGTSNYTWKIITEPVTRGTGRQKRCACIRLICDRQLVSGNILVEYSDNDGSTFKTAGNLDVSQDCPFLDSLGSYRRRVWRLSSSTVPCLIDAMEEEYEEMAN